MEIVIGHKYKNRLEHNTRTSHPLSSCSSSSSSSRSTTAAAGAIDYTAAAGALYSSSHCTHLPSAISLAAASRVQAGVFRAPKWALFFRLVCFVGREYKEQ